METETTRCYSYFAICSEGTIVNGLGLVAAPDGDFSPEVITELLGITPYRYRRMGEPRKNGRGTSRFSSWSACYQDTPALDTQEQVMKIVHTLSPKIPILQTIKQQYNVSFSILIVPHIYHEQSPGIVFGREIIDFCYHTGTDIGVDLYVYSDA